MPSDPDASPLSQRRRASRSDSPAARRRRAAVTARFPCNQPDWQSSSDGFVAGPATIGKRPQAVMTMQDPSARAADSVQRRRLERPERLQRLSNQLLPCRGNKQVADESRADTLPSRSEALALIHPRAAYVGKEEQARPGREIPTRPPPECASGFSGRHICTWPPIGENV